MWLTFNIEYHTEWGEEVRICGSVSELGNMEENKASALQTDDGTHWSLSIEVPFSVTGILNYYYAVFRSGKMIRKEWNVPFRSLIIDGNRKAGYKIYDSWREIPRKSYEYSEAFTQVFLKRENIISTGKSDSSSLLMAVSCSGINTNQTIALSGNQEILGNWDSGKIRLPDACNFPEYQFKLELSELASTIEYKFVLYNLKNKQVESWESGPNRFWMKPEISADETVIISAPFIEFDLPVWRFAGVSVPVFSLRTENSFGIGDFADLKKMVDWAAMTGQSLIQILPVNDTTMTHTWKDSYPYNTISIYAFHPMYLSLDGLGVVENQDKRDYFDRVRKLLNALPAVDYEQVNKYKWDYFRLLFDQKATDVLSSAEYLQFFEENKEWLIPYAAFSYLRDVYRTPDFRKWPKYSIYNVEEINCFCRPGTKDYAQIAIYYYLQYNLHRQLLEVRSYAREKGVALKGDIPIGISRNSVEAWTEPYYFNLDGQAGAPPDDFSVNGQNWGFPTYNWDVMKADGYSWWIKRFRKMSGYFDAYRIDHILGFFRIWEIPLDSVHGLLGQFVPALPMDKEEIESYGLRFEEKKYLEPYIDESFLQLLFGINTQFVKDTFICRIFGEGRYEMRPDFDTQRKVKTYFSGKTDSGSLAVRDGLYTLISNVLFVRDRKDPSKFHPRISVRNDFIYRILAEQEQVAFDRLYEHYFYHRHTDFWYGQAMDKLPVMLRSNSMLACGEDLGMIPACVGKVMNELQILSLEIERMPKIFGLVFGQPFDNPYRSVCTISTHDMSTLRGWWKEDRQKTQLYFNRELGHEGLAPEVASGAICEDIIVRHLRSNSMLAIFSLQDWLSMDEKWRNPDIEAERINVPADPDHYWRYRMHLTLEQLISAGDLTEKITDLVDRSVRSFKK